ncbi:uncharacterized protein PGTG_07933 [Puccinia graminis f. sp. tritici CRL 75-36-700-3]|uniref:mannan endo-1,4-beta-mannosidase n=1 Tax=Puccinia graminis f. sp. tritici (strain CRL 75-36-700-3 / race SCCL) TaxID=418459 RepID=E3KBI6_PUCGT|nr:uncharacterized protein PGTG_07933 [Puccinia graminis f. sp. tritici CRL 75-36-700-3]EFP81684.2 hypothetical protein PGTG_07933 [Puccinia graminis f. sp. tritici CRL 75-36-700-3]
MSTLKSWIGLTFCILLGLAQGCEAAMDKPISCGDLVHHAAQKEPIQIEQAPQLLPLCPSCSARAPSIIGDPDQTGVGNKPEETLHREHSSPQYLIGGRGVPDGRQMLRPSPHPASSSGGAANNRGRFIIRNPATAQLEVEGTGEVVRFASLCAPDLFDNEGFEKEDTMRTIAQFGKWPVTRTYTLKVKSTRISRGHINGWDPELEDFLYDEDMFVSIDHTIALAAQYNVRLIIPIINQDYGSEETNWVGNFTDLIRHRRGVRKDRQGLDWWRDEECLDSMKKIVSFLLNRVNTFTGVRIGDDPTILAFETGNEMNFGGLSPAPGDWTLEIARHIKSLAPKALVMDGSFARNDAIEHSHDHQALRSELVDIVGYHYYGYGDKWRVEKDVKVARAHGTAFICGEYGFFADGQQFEYFLKHCDQQGVSGTLAWSLRPHSVKGGFQTHGEGNEIWSYHAPGWEPARLSTGQHPEWDHRERDVIRAIRKAAFELTNQEPPPIRLEHSPELFLCSNGESFTWRGVAWADSYELWISPAGQAEPAQEIEWKFFQGGITDNIKQGHLKYSVDDILRLVNCNSLRIIMRGISADNLPGPFSKPLRITSQISSDKLDPATPSGASKPIIKCNIL